jgi:hypothetical protein
MCYGLRLSKWNQEAALNMEGVWGRMEIMPKNGEAYALLGVSICVLGHALPSLSTT